MIDCVKDRYLCIDLINNTCRVIIRGHGPLTISSINKNTKIFKDDIGTMLP